MNNKKLSIRVLFPLIMSISIVFCILSCMILFSHYISTYLVRKTIEETSRQKNVLAQNIENEIDSINSIMNNIYYNTIKKYDLQDKNFKTILANEITSNSETIYGLALYDTDGKNLWHSNNLTSTSMQNKSWFTQAKDNIETICYGSKKLVYPDNVKQVFQISRYVEYINHGKMKSGVLLMQYYTDSIDSILEHYKNTQNSYCYLLDNTSNFLYHPFIKEISSGLYKENTTKIALNSTNYSIKKLHGTKWLIERQQIGYTGWNIVLVSSLFNIHTENMGIYYVIWLLLLIVGIILVFTDILLFHDFTNPVYQLLDTMQEFGKGNYEVKAAENGIGELKTLSAHFNIMAEKLQNQMDEIRRNEREKRKMEKKLLQSQINPHFLYNTLDSIIWMIQSGEYKGAEQMVSSLAKFFRISLSQGKDIIPLEKELEHATSYLAIQNIRFKDKFEFSVQADKKLLHYLCPKLSIQPLLENAIYHGMEGVYDDGEITISVYEKDNLIHIDVSDNGLGMPEKVVEYIMHNRVVSSKRGSGIGVRNVDERIKLIYGEQYGVTIESELDEGTSATIIIPKLEETAEINSDESNKTKL